MNTKTPRFKSFNYFGGKSRYLDFILPLIPEHEHYLEAFCGSATVFFNKVPSRLETISDQNSRIANFFKVLRDNPEKLIEKLLLTPYSREEFQKALPKSRDRIEDARRFFVRVQMSFGGDGFSKKRINSWRYSMTDSRHGVNNVIAKYYFKVEHLLLLVDRLRMAVIENRDAFYTIPKIDGKNTFIYLDPPYPHEARTNGSDYLFELNNDQHIKLAEIVNEAKSKVMISGYNCPLMQKLYPEDRCQKIPGPLRATNLGKNRNPDKREFLWINYSLKTKQTILFS